MPRGIPRGRSAGKHTQLRHRRTALVAAPVVTALAIGAGVLTSGSADPTRATAADAASSVSAATSGTPAPATSGGPTSVRRTAPSPVHSSTTEARTLGTSRSVDRVPLVDNRVPKATGKLWTTEDLDLRTAPAKSARTAGLVKTGQHVTVTGRRSGDYAEVIVAPLTTRWVTADYLAKNKTPEVMGLSDAPCPDGSSIESALQPQSVKVYRAVCAAFPELSAYGGQDGHGEHVNGEAIDFMVPSSSVGERVKDFVYAHHAELDLFDIIWSQHIWTIERSGEGFRSMSDRGSATANHFDHVHIKIN